MTRMGTKALLSHFKLARAKSKPAFAKAEPAAKACVDALVFASAFSVCLAGSVRCGRVSGFGTIRNFVRGGAGYHLGGCLNEALTERDGELGFSC